MQQPDPHFEALLLYLKDSRGFDFTGYKRSSIERRVTRRMQQVGCADYVEYLDHLQVHPDEFTALFNTILINVTGFFRDPDAWEHLRSAILPELLEAKGDDTPLRIWSAGCASGEEAYTLAIALAETMGIEEYRRRVKIYATDVDEDSLAHARLAAYSERDVEGLEPDLVERYFEFHGGRYTFRKDLRRSVIFGRNDLVQDSPISRIDVLVCRNTLMYFNAETQARILSRFHFALADTGVLFLGKAEMLLSHTDLFNPIDLKRRIFRKATRPPAVNGAADRTEPVHRTELVGLDRLRAEALMANAVAQVVVTADGLVALTNRQSELLLGVSLRDVGRPFRDLELSYRPAELRGYIEQVQVERRAIRLQHIEYQRSPGDLVYLDVHVKPLVDTGTNSLLGVTLIFDDVTAAHRLQEELEATTHQLEAAYEELQSTNEELETTNEELQSTVEELETTNEELQSTNEELETMNEELHSTNDELQSINDELRDRTTALDNANTFLETIMTGIQAGVVVIGRELHVRVWNRYAEDLWGVRPDEAIGQHFFNLDIGLPIEQLRPLIRKVIGGAPESQQVELAAVNRRGRTIEVRVTCTALSSDDPAMAVLLMMEPTTPSPPAPGADLDA